MKLISCLFLAILLSAVCAASVSADYAGYEQQNGIEQYEEIYEHLYNAIADEAEQTDLSAYQLRTDDLMQIYADILASTPEFFYLENKISYYYKTVGVQDIVTAVSFQYKMTGEELDAAQLRYEQELSYIVSMVDPSLSEAEKALWVHDYLIAACSYDESQTYYDAYSLFCERKGVCQAYALAYIAVLRELGMHSVMVASEEMNHAWNLVKVDGEWYHADLVYDDPAPDRIGRVIHENFLLNDEEIMHTSDPHVGWESGIVCTSDVYTEAIWKDILSPMVWCGRQWYYIDLAARALLVSDISGEGKTEILSFKEKWYTDETESRYWVGIFSGVAEYRGYIFVNTPYRILIYNPKNSSIMVFHEAETGERFFGSGVYKNALEYLYADQPIPDGTETEEERRIEISPIKDFDIEEFYSPMPFEDVSRLDRHYAAVRFVYNKGLFQGVSSTKFAPDAPLTRAMFVTVLGRLCRVNKDDYIHSDFSDVPDGQWYTPYVGWAAQLGLVNGVGENRFDPMGDITHEQMIKIVAQLGLQLGAGITEYAQVQLPYTDTDSVADWALDGVRYCRANRLIHDEGALLPAVKTLRAEAAEIVARLAALCALV
ncbi:MAG: S-layer homology domain-containing protein [Clostridia bacterium]|nr:S-layer homology domain-containing protein [Clostridia bacterium]